MTRRCCLLLPLIPALLLIFPLLLSMARSSSAINPAWNADEKAAAEFLETAEGELLEGLNRLQIVWWAYETNITDFNEKRRLEEKQVFNTLKLRLGKEAKTLLKDSVKDEGLKLKLTKLVRYIDVSILPKDKLQRYNQLVSEMGRVQSTAKVANYTDPSHLLSLNPEVSDAMLNSIDPDERAYYWKASRDATGKKTRKKFLEVIELTNEAARLNGLKDGAEMKNAPYESPTFMSDMEKVWNKLKPLYQKFHAYTRSRLQEKYGKALVPDNAPVPEHLPLTTNKARFLKPYPKKPDIDVTEQMMAKGWTVKKMFQTADEFFQSLGLDPMPQEFWNGSLIEKPADGRDVVCHASAWDFYNGKDFRIKMCTQINQFDFTTVTHEMGHTQYQMSYRNQTYLFRYVPNPGFHEGVADIMSLVAGTSSYLKKLDLLTDAVDVEDYETNINVLYNMAVLKLRAIPSDYKYEKLRWDLYTGNVSLDDVNCHYVRLNADIDGTTPPVERSEDDFDAGVIYHLANDIDVIQYFNALIYQFQFYRELCLVSKQYEPGNKYKPLHRCNFYGSKEAGEKLFEMLKLGASKPWPQVMEVMTGEPRLNTQAFIEYFAPLEEWLDEYIKDNNITVGWEDPDYTAICKSSSTNSSINITVSNDSVGDLDNTTNF